MSKIQFINKQSLTKYCYTAHGGKYCKLVFRMKRQCNPAALALLKTSPTELQKTLLVNDIEVYFHSYLRASLTECTRVELFCGKLQAEQSGMSISNQPALPLNF